MVLLRLAGRLALSVQICFWGGSDYCRASLQTVPPSLLRILRCMTSSLDGSAVKKKYIYIHTYIQYIYIYEWIIVVRCYYTVG